MKKLFKPYQMEEGELGLIDDRNVAEEKQELVYVYARGGPAFPGPNWQRVAGPLGPEIAAAIIKTLTCKGYEFRITT